MRRTWGVIALSSVVAAGIAGGATALTTATSTSTTTVRVCVKTSINTVVAPRSDGKCPSGATKITINRQGPKGATGATGLSAYELAVKQGFRGTLDQWLASLEGADATASPGPTVTVTAGPDVVDGGTP